MPELSTMLQQAAPQSEELDTRRLRARVAERRRNRRRFVTVGAVVCNACIALVAIAGVSLVDNDRINTGTRRTPSAGPTTTEPVVSAADPSIEGTLTDGRAWRLSEDLEHGLCLTVANTDFGCN